MLYSSPELGAALGRLRERGIRKLVVLPLFPQYCGATTGAVSDRVNAELRQHSYAPELCFIAAEAGAQAPVEIMLQRLFAAPSEEEGGGGGGTTRPAAPPASR